MPNTANTKATKATSTKRAVKTPEAKKADAPAVAEAKPLSGFTRAERGLARDAATVTAGRYNANTESGRDDAYTKLLGAVIRAAGKTTSCTLADIIAHCPKAANGSPFNPFYTGSNKATDAGALQRQAKFGRFTVSADGKTYTVTKAGSELSVFKTGKFA